VLCLDSVDSNLALCFISFSNVTGLNSEEFALAPLDPEFAGMGLKVASKVRSKKHEYYNFKSTTYY